MNNKNTNKKGFTIVELVIVLAVLVIAAGMVVTFSSMMHGAQGVSNARYEALQDVRVAESLIESFIENNSNKGLTVEKNYSTAGDKLYYKIGDEEYAVFFTNAKAFVMSGNEVLFFESIESIVFEIVTGNDDTLYYCTITYDVGGTDFNYTFCVNPYVGE